MEENQILTILLEIKEEQGNAASKLITMESYTKEKLESIEAQCKLTNGRVTALETARAVDLGDKSQRGKIWGIIAACATLIALFLAVPWDHIKAAFH